MNRRAPLRDPRPRILLRDYDMGIRKECIAYLVEHNRQLVTDNAPPLLVNYAGRPTVLSVADEQAALSEVRGPLLRNLLGDAVHFQKPMLNLPPKTVPPPQEIVAAVQADLSNAALPKLARVVPAPVFDPDGQLVTKIGYNPRTGVYYLPTVPLTIPPIPEHPTDAQIASARDYLLGPLVDFPFRDPRADRANAVAFMIEPFVRDLIDGPMPLHLFDKPTYGTGATVLVQLLLMPFLGKRSTR